MEAIRRWTDIFKRLKGKKKKEKNCQPKILNLAKLFFKSEEESRHFQINKS